MSPRSLALICCTVALACSAGSGGAGAGGAGDAADATGGAGNAGRGGPTLSSCSPYGGPTTSTIDGSGFDQWNGQSVQACLYPTQSFSPDCEGGVVAGGQFSVTATVCTGYAWQITVGTGAGAIGCSATVDDGYITPAACFCDSGMGGASGAAGQPGLGCDAGVGGDAANPDASEEFPPPVVCGSDQYCNIAGNCCDQGAVCSIEPSDAGSCRSSF
jgi:hypothetical protein